HWYRAESGRTRPRCRLSPAPRERRNGARERRLRRCSIYSGWCLFRTGTLECMSEYRPPLDDIDFVLNHVAGFPEVAKLDGFQHLDPDTVRGILAEGGRFFAEVMAPLNRIGDQQGSVLEDGEVRTPEGFKEAYAQYVEAGWGGAHIPEEYGGGGLPYTVGI